MNINTETGIRFGYISSNKLDPEVVHTLMFEVGVDLAFEEYMAELEEKYGEDFDEYTAVGGYHCEEPIITGSYEGVSYSSSWLGGALNFFIFESPVITKCALCSPCVPGAGDLGSEGEFEAYGVPDNWLKEE